MGAIVWISAVQFFVAQFVVQSAWTTPYSLTGNYVSDLGNTRCAPFLVGSEYLFVCSPWHAWMNASFVVLGLQILLGAALLRAAFPRGRWRGAGLALIALAGPGLVLVGLFPEDVALTPHKVGAGLQFLSGNAGIAVLGAAMARDRSWRGPAIFSIASGLIGLLATWLFVSEQYLGLGIGGMERVAAYALPIWVIVLGAYFTQATCQRGAVFRF